MAKRSQIAVGQEWAYQRCRQHEYTPWGAYKKAIIVAVEPYERGYSKNYQTQKGNGVLVKFESGHEQVVQLSQLWKPWAEYEIGQAEYKAQWEISQAKAKIAKAERQKFQEEVYFPALRQFIQTIKPFAGNSYVSGSIRIEELPVEVLVAVTEALKEKAVA